MTYLARLVSITRVSAIPPNIMPFVTFQAQQRNVELADATEVIVLQVENIPSYHIFFPKTGITIEELEKELAKSDTRLTPETRGLIGEHLQKKT
ncbi:MAG: DUF749 family protein [Thermoplasmata archaeon]|nr:MAG: DUF749 family protein [Thermoplasmata archaeon]